MFDLNAALAWAQEQVDASDLILVPLFTWLAVWAARIVVTYTRPRLLEEFKAWPLVAAIFGLGFGLVLVDLTAAGAGAGALLGLMAVVGQEGLKAMGNLFKVAGAAAKGPPVVLLLLAVSAALLAGCAGMPVRPPETLRAQYVRLSENFSDVMETLDELYLIGWITPGAWRERVLPPAEAGHAVLGRMEADVAAGRTEPWTEAEGIGAVHDALRDLRLQRDVTGTRPLPPNEAGMSGDVWLALILLFTGALDRLLRWYERGQVTDVTDEQVAEATGRRQAVMARARRIGEGDGPASLVELLRPLDLDASTPPPDEGGE